MNIRAKYDSLHVGVKTAIWVTVGIGIVFVATKLLRTGKRLLIKGDTKNNPSFYASYLIANNHASPPQQDFLLEADAGYLLSWYEAAKKNETTFNFNGKKYVVKGGRAAT
jgi:hypothetical protein